MRSPIQTMWPEVAYQSPEVESIAGHRLLEPEQQRLVAGEEIRLAQFGMRFRVDSDRAHEAHRLGDLVGQRLVALALRAVGDKAEHPLMDVLKIGIAAGGEGAKQVQRRGRLAVSHLLARRIGNTRLGREFEAR